jgi:hypothetical protein
MASQASSVVESGRDAVVIASFDSYRRAEHMLISLSSASRSRSSWAPSAAAASPHSMPIGPVRIEPRVAAVVPGVSVPGTAGLPGLRLRVVAGLVPA